MSKTLWVEKYAQSYKSSKGRIDGWEVRFYLVDSVAQLQDLQDNGDYTDAWCLDDDYCDLDEREDLDWWDTSASGPPVTWYVGDASGFDDLECPDLLSSVMEGKRPMFEDLKQAIVACEGCFEELDGKPTS